MTPVLCVPWAVVEHDNHRLMPSRRGTSVRLVTSPSYRRKKQAAERTLMVQWKGRAKLMGPIVLHARCYFPDARKRDAGNYRKLVTDALSGIAYTDDAQLHRETWERAGVDHANPRIELTIWPAAQESVA